MMNDFLKKVVKGSAILPPDIHLQSFSQNFENAVNTEWYSRDNYYEAVFYKNNLEHIAIFDLDGNLTEYSQNLSADCLPGPVKHVVLAKGEIMNSVMRIKGNLIEYEVIVRDRQLRRYLLILTESGKIITDNKL